MVPIVAPTVASTTAPGADPIAALTAAPKRNFQGARILLAEDNPVNRMVAVRFLDKLGVTVDVATDGKEAVEKWKPGRYAAIFMDCQMPTMDGYDATRAIRALEREAGSGCSTPIIALTAHAMEEARDRCLDSGMDDYMTKPVRPESFLAALNRWVPMGSEGSMGVVPELPQRAPVSGEDAEGSPKKHPGSIDLAGMESAAPLRTVKPLVN